MMMDDTAVFHLLRKLIESSTEALERLYLDGVNSHKLWVAITVVRRDAGRLPAMYEAKYGNSRRLPKPVPPPPTVTPPDDEDDDDEDFL